MTPTYREELLAERKWAKDELLNIERVKKDETVFRAQLAELEDLGKKLERILPDAPRGEEWVPVMETSARNCGAGLVAYEPATIEHDRYGELRFPVEVEGDEKTVNCFRTRLRNRARTSSWSDTGKSDDGKTLADVSIFYVPANDGASRPCKDFDAVAVRNAGSHFGELERVLFQSTFQELQKICREIEASPEERRLATRHEDLMARIGLSNELQIRYEPEP